MPGQLAVTCLFVLSMVLTTIAEFVLNDNDFAIKPYPNGKVWREKQPGKYTPPLYYMNDYCLLTTVDYLTLDTRDFIRMSLWNTDKPPSLSYCKVRVQNRKYSTYDLGVTFKSINMTGMKNGGCEMSRLNLYNGFSTSSVYRINNSSGICGTSVPKEQYVTTENKLTLLFTTGNLLVPTYQMMDAVLTPFHKGTCKDDEFKCANSNCIKNNTLCDTYDNCGDDSDEKGCFLPKRPADKGLSIAVIIGLAVGGALLVTIVIVLVCCCCCCSYCEYEKLQ